MEDREDKPGTPRQLLKPRCEQAGTYWYSEIIMVPELLTMSESIWDTIQREAARAATAEPALAAWMYETVINQATLASSLAHFIAVATKGSPHDKALVRQISEYIYHDEPSLVEIATRDLKAPLDRDPACSGPLQVLLHFKGYIALQGYRISNRLWERGRVDFALELHSSISRSLNVSIHPSAIVGSGLFIDHGTGVTIGEGVIIDEEVSILQEVTLSSLPDSPAGAPRIGRGVLLSAGATILGNIRIGDFAKIGAGSLVLTSVPSGHTAVGVPARLIAPTSDPKPGLSMEQSLP